MHFPATALRSSALSNGALFLILPLSHSHSHFSTSSYPSSLGIGATRSMLPSVHVAGGVRFHGTLPLNDDVEDYEVVFEHCVTRTLPPALTLEEGLQKFKDALEILKLSPPPSSTGFLRFQVVVPPSPKALSWFCCQPESSAVFPLIFVSKNMDNPTCKSLFVNGSRGVFGVGAAVSFVHSSAVNNKSLIKRYISTDSTNIVAYGFMDINLDNDSVSTNREDGCFSLFIPQIELDEMESVSILTMTLAWDNFSLSNFGKALHLLEVSLNQVIRHVWSPSTAGKSKCVRAALRNLSLVEDRSISRV